MRILAEFRIPRHDDLSVCRSLEVRATSGSRQDDVVPFALSSSFEGPAPQTMPYRCREKQCSKERFSLKPGTVMVGSKLGFQVQVIATYLMSTNLTSVSSMKLGRDLEINQRTGSSRTGSE